MHDWRAHTGAWPLSQAYLALFLPHPLWAGASSLVYQALRPVSGVGGWVARHQSCSNSWPGHLRISVVSGLSYSSAGPGQGKGDVGRGSVWTLSQQGKVQWVRGLVGSVPCQLGRRMGR